MRLLVVSQYFWPESFRINDVAASLAGRGVHVDVLTGKPNYPEGSIFAGYRAGGVTTEQWEGARVLRVPLIPRGKSGALGLVSNYLSFIASASFAGPWLLRKSRPQAILVYCLSPLLQALPALLLGRIKNAPVILWIQDLWPESLEATGYVSNRWVLAAVRSVVRFIYRRADLILISSQPFAEQIRSLVPESRIIYYPNSVDAAFCDPDAGAKPDLPVLDQGFSVVFAGNVGSAQAMEVIVDAAAILAGQPEIRLVVLGSGSRLDWMRKQVAERRLENVHLAGRFPVAAMPYLLAKASALLVTLSNRPIFSATVPSKVQAYMAVGRPIVACLNGEGARLVQEARAGLSVPAEDARGLADAILRLYRMSPEERERLGANGRAYYHAHFDHDKLVSNLIDHVQTVIGGRA
jgi:glycosyltransferase involved in cell wall biosynthesis